MATLYPQGAMTSRSNRLLGPETRPCVQSESHSYSRFVNGVQLDMMNSLTHLLNTAESGELNAIIIIINSLLQTIVHIHIKHLKYKHIYINNAFHWN